LLAYISKGRYFFVFIVEVQPLLEHEFQLLIVLDEGDLSDEMLLDFTASGMVKFQEVGLVGDQKFRKNLLRCEVCVVDGAGCEIFGDDATENQHYFFRKLCGELGVFAEAVVEEGEKM
jgi:hypothetical protein